MYFATKARKHENAQNTLQQTPEEHAFRGAAGYIRCLLVIFFFAHFPCFDLCDLSVESFFPRKGRKGLYAKTAKKDNITLATLRPLDLLNF
ncbi:MAG: hypothetical protein EA394_03225 [Bacteroidia bacterium]|nr:MAG: hypothetical protein EA394_03225 [Bacteroidia bacterium]